MTLRNLIGAGGLLMAASMVGLSTPAQALTINLIDTGGVTGSPAEQGFKIAAKYWEHMLSNDAVLNINVGYEDLGPDVLGSTGSSLFTYIPIADYFDALAFTGTSALDATAVAHLPGLSPTGSIKLKVPGYLNNAGLPLGIDNTTQRYAPDGMEITQTLALSTANFKALAGGYEDIVDADITFSSAFSFDFDPTNGIDFGSYDFIGVAIHEIGHALGFLSGADDFDYSDGYLGSVDDAWWAYGLDMFRYQDDRLGPINSLVPGADACFSVDGGETAYLGGCFSTGTNFGDGWQASHWLSPGDCSQFLGIMNPYVCNGTNAVVTGLDLASLDAIGWNLTDGVRDKPLYSASTADIYRLLTAVPEPKTWAMMIGGFALVGASLRRRKTSVSFA